MAEGKKLMSAGIVGTTVTAVCCATPLPVLLLGAVGLSAFAGYLDYVLVPALVLFAGLTAYAFYLRRKARARCAADDASRV